VNKMKNKERTSIIHPFSGVGAVFFPVGPLSKGGTCEFATDTCLRECAALKYATEENKIPYKDKKTAYRFITINNANLVTVQILKELHRMNTKILYWFASGDCPGKNTGRVANTIKNLHDCGIIQQGFTRNVELWLRVREERNVHMVLTVENWKDILDEWKTVGLGNVFAYPDYQTGEVVIIQYDWECREPKYRYRCGSISTGGAPTWRESTCAYVAKEIKREANCQRCYDESVGCFTSEGKNVTAYAP